MLFENRHYLGENHGVQEIYIPKTHQTDESETHQFIFTQKHA